MLGTTYTSWGSLHFSSRRVKKYNGGKIVRVEGSGAPLRIFFFRAGEPSANSLHLFRDATYLRGAKNVFALHKSRRD